MPKSVVVFGASGSVGSQALSVIASHPEHFKLAGISLYQKTLPEAPPAKIFRAKELEGLSEREKIKRIQLFLQKTNPDIVLNAVSGFAGIFYSLATLELGLPLALANKESLVAGGAILMELSRKHHAPIIPVDSEHAALSQCLGTTPPTAIKCLYLTCSGGPFWDREDLSTVTLKEALHHPTWNMGRAITIDSATLANKALEVFEAMTLFSLPFEKINILIHRESLAHGIITFEDGNTLMHLSPPSMHHPIFWALSYPKRQKNTLPTLDLTQKPLQFFPPKEEKFPILKSMQYAAKKGGNLPLAFNAANEVARNAFLKEEIAFLDIPKIVAHTLEQMPFQEITSLNTIFEQDKKARQIAKAFLASLKKEKR